MATGDVLRKRLFIWDGEDKRPIWNGTEEDEETKALFADMAEQLGLRWDPKTERLAVYDLYRNKEMSLKKGEDYFLAVVEGPPRLKPSKKK